VQPRGARKTPTRLPIRTSLPPNRSSSRSPGKRIDRARTPEHSLEPLFRRESERLGEDGFHRCVGLDDIGVELKSARPNQPTEGLVAGRVPTAFPLRDLRPVLPDPLAERPLRETGAEPRLPDQRSARTHPSTLRVLTTNRTLDYRGGPRKCALPGRTLKPSQGLEPWTPSLPLKSPRGNRRARMTPQVPQL
jgi:hypothetical protein